MSHHRSSAVAAAVAVGDARRLRGFARRRSRADSHERYRCARAAYRARGDQPEPAGDGAAYRCAAGRAAHHARRSRAAAEPERGWQVQTRNLYGDLEKRLAALETLGGVGPAAGRPGQHGQRRVARSRRRRQAAANRPATTPPSMRSRAVTIRRAITGFRGFVATYPRERAGEQRAVLAGRGLLRHQEYQNAIAAFQKVTTDWPDSRKAPDALVKVGFTQSAMGRNGDARVTLEDVVRRYPGTEAAQLATERLKRLPASGQMNATGNRCRRRRTAEAGRRLKITEIFYSLQGEADTVGFPTVFVRLTGCPLRCQYCDTAYAFHGGEWLTHRTGARTAWPGSRRATCASRAVNRWRRRTACRCSAAFAMPATACRSRPAAPCRWPASMRG